MQYLTVDDVARILKLSPTTVRRHIRSGALPAIRVGRRLRVSESSLALGSATGRGASGTTRTQRPASPGARGEGPARRRAQGLTATTRASRESGLTGAVGPFDPETDDVQERWRRALKRSAELHREILARRPGRPLPDSAPLIRAMREGRLR